MKIVTYPDPMLHEVSDPIKDIERSKESLTELSEELTKVMEDSKGIGMSAIQLGTPLMVFVFKDGDNVKVAINPEIHNQSDETETEEERCLSIPQFKADVNRPKTVDVSYYTLDNKRIEETLEGLSARVFSHELDHCHGILICDGLSKLRNDMLIKKIKKHKKRMKTQLDSFMEMIKNQNQPDIHRAFTNHLLEDKLNNYSIKSNEKLYVKDMNGVKIIKYNPNVIIDGDEIETISADGWKIPEVRNKLLENLKEHDQYIVMKQVEDNIEFYIYNEEVKE